MRVNADFGKRAVVRFGSNPWLASPSAGVERKMLDRIGEEVARATTIVRFEPNAEFHAHTHDAGEEFIVLEGQFEDEYGKFPAGSYIRNPPTSRHAPSAPLGAVIMVKLRQMDLADREHVRLSTFTASRDLLALVNAKDDDVNGGLVKEPVLGEGEVREMSASEAIIEGDSGARYLPLYSDAREKVRMEFWPPNTPIKTDADGGLEVFVLAGSVTVDDGDTGTGDNGVLTKWDWSRLPPGDSFRAQSGDCGAQLWVKTGHLGSEGLVQ